MAVFMPLLCNAPIDLCIMLVDLLMLLLYLNLLLLCDCRRVAT